MLKTDQLDSAAAASAKTTWLGAVIGALGAISVSEIVAIGGFALAVIGFLLNWYYKYKGDKRAQRLFELREQRLLAGRSDNAPLDEVSLDE